MATTDNLDITLLEEAQAGKEVAINQALQAIDAEFGTCRMVALDASAPVTITGPFLLVGVMLTPNIAQAALTITEDATQILSMKGPSYTSRLLAPPRSVPVSDDATVEVTGSGALAYVFVIDL